MAARDVKRLVEASRAGLLPFALTLAAALAIAWPTLAWPMTYDDLHLIRSFSGAELGHAFHGNWDPDDIEVSGFRPLFPLFNHVRYALFGENVVLHRLFLLTVYALTIAALATSLRRLGFRPAVVVGGGLLALASRYSVYHYAFLTDGAHVLQGALFALALAGALDWVADARRPRLAASVAALLAGLLLREDTLAVVPVVMGAALVLAGRDPDPRRRAIVLVAAIGATCLLVWTARSLFVPRLPRVQWDLAAVAVAVARSLSLVGREGFDAPSRAVVAAGRMLPLALLVPSAWRAGRMESARTLGAAAAAVIACTPALAVSRENLLFFPVLFAGLAYASVLAALARAGRLGGVIAAAIGLLLLAGELAISRPFQLAFHPYSATSLRWSGDFVYGVYSGATIPPRRRQDVIDRLARIGIRDEGQFVEKLPRKTFTAIIEGPWRPTAEPRLFVPPLSAQAFRP